MTCAVCFNQVADAHGLSFNEYQRQAFTTAVYPGKGSNIIYTILGLCGEAGEVAEKIKKVLRDKGGVIDEETKEAIVKELGDVLWYVSATCGELNVEMEDVAKKNIAKLAARKAKGMLQGSGDNR
jgi:NTP pyrophosphatase (non-canonical NTP hydrolase)